MLCAQAPEERAAPVRAPLMDNLSRAPGAPLAAAGRAIARARREAPGLVAAAIALGFVLAFASPAGVPWPTGREAFCYWVPVLADPYALANWTSPVAYVYSPAFLQVLAPLKALPWPAFLAAWTTILLLAVRWLVGPRLWPLAILVAAPELAGGNIHLLLAVAIVAGFRWPAAWAFMLLTKVTPGVGLIWFVVRGEWGRLGVALGATAAIVVGSFAIDPSAWARWIDVLVSSAGKTPGTWAAIGIPLVLRFPVAVALVAWGARTDRRWTVPAAAMVALPALWFGGLSMLLAVVALRRRGTAWAETGTGGGRGLRVLGLAREPVRAQSS
jgi:Glycosyltransferase family 87